MSDYKCSRCGAPAYYDAEYKRGPTLLCSCAQRGKRWVGVGLSGGGHWLPANAIPILVNGPATKKCH